MRGYSDADFLSGTAPPLAEENMRRAEPAPAPPDIVEV
jgi:hypothetical protein